MWLTGLDCLSSLPESVTGMSAAALQGMGVQVALRHSVENLCRTIDCLTCPEPGDPGLSPWAPPTADCDDAGNPLPMPLMSQEEAEEYASQHRGSQELPMLARRVCLSARALADSDIQGHLKS